ncbi:response regulator transcription factor [Nguyenibacter sp. L1]|uniref:response regulator transcription factor n=1 Tax=Nguyenibacter sp. L1 TaxID=3049350 RepID=UPI002B4A160C|nr:response regulator transcription factor [Nguyenibacter sp. L1]WRH89459.1 response regulator transcription factor [Nguyenibacter sp. L1]
MTTLDGKPPGRRISVLLVEDQIMILDALAALLALEPDLDIAGRASDGMQALAMARRLCPDVLVSDIEMPGLTGLELAERLRAHALPTRVVVLTTFGRTGYLRRALDAGVHAYLLKDSPGALLADTIRTVAAGGRHIAPELAEAIWDAPPDPLNARERAVLRLAEAGHSNRAIADRLGLAPGTVRNYLSDAAQKLGAGNRIEAGRIARSNGWL